MTTKIALQVDGGGIRGITPALVLAELERRLRADNPDLKIHQLLSLCSGTSTGAIIAGMVCAGIDAQNIRKFYADDGVKLFAESKNPFYSRIFRPKYKRDPFVAKLNDILEKASKNKDVTLGQLARNVLFMATAYNLCSYRTHFIKSDDAIDRGRRLSDVIRWSALSAAYYFGKIDVPDYEWKFVSSDTPSKEDKRRGAVFQDGGQGTQNCTLGFTLIEILARGWDKENVIIISLGTGTKTKSEGYDKARNTCTAWQAVKYLSGQARKEATPIQILEARYVESTSSNIKIYRLDYEMDNDYALDDLDHVNAYQRGANEIIESKPFEELVLTLKNVF
jgi:hypothetical protein